jgi:catechol 2,3-dioxygenase-like lactoylglutathione lyase family enzyme
MFTGLGHAAFQVSDLEASVAHATQVLGLREMDRIDGVTYLTHGPAQPSLAYRQGRTTMLDHFALQASSFDALDTLRTRLREAGVTVLADGAFEPYAEAAVRFSAPDGHVIEAFVPTASDSASYGPQGHPPYLPTGARPRHLGHVNLTAPDVGANTAFFTDVLGFRLSDTIVDESGHRIASFLRCSPSHHTVAVMDAPAGLLHVAFGVDSMQDIVRLGDLLDATGGGFMWGPGRHGAGDNIATYFRDPSGVPIEYYSEMQLIYDDRWQPRTWSISDPRVLSIWGAALELSPLFEAAIPRSPASELVPSV